MIRQIKFIFSLALACALRGQFAKFRVLYAQAKLESGFSNGLFLDLNNPFSMGMPQYRPRWVKGSFSSGVEDGSEPALFATYWNYFQACWDRLLFDKANDIQFVTASNYMTDISNLGYATDPNYYDKWVEVYSQNKVFWMLPLVFVWLAACVYMTYVYIKLRYKKPLNWLLLLPWLVTAFMFVSIKKNRIK